jgi:5-formyltetrahydrofolate cyclo-ligase
MSDGDVATAKAVLRVMMTEARATIEPAARADAAGALVDIWRGAPLADPPATVAGFWPMRHEIDIRPLLLSMFDAGHQLALPMVTRRGQPLIFRAWRPADTLTAGPFGTLQPEATRAEVDPDIVLVPFLAADRDGYRLGYGAGYYDRTLEHFRARRPVQAIGVGFDLQRLEAVPRDAGDQRLDWLLTEAGAFAFV